MPAIRALPVTSLSFLVLGGAYLIESLYLPLGPAAQPGPGFFPLLVGIAMIVFSLHLFIQSLKPEEGPAEKEDPFPRGKDLQRVVAIAGTLIFFRCFFEYPWVWSMQRRFDRRSPSIFGVEKLDQDFADLHPDSGFFLFSLCLCPRSSPSSGGSFFITWIPSRVSSMVWA